MAEMTPLFKMACIYQCMDFTGDMHTAEDGESEPDWVQTERKQFSEFRDTNKVKEHKDLSGQPSNIFT